MSDESFVQLLDGRALPVEKFGSKASVLSELSSQGFSIPVGVCLSCDAYLAAVADIQNDTGVSRPELLREQLMTRIPPPALIGLVLDALVEVGVDSASRLIVRSSAVGEDSGERSFAGQLDSVSDVPLEPGPLSLAISQVWSSAWGSRAMLYRRRNDLEEIGALPVAVLIQVFVEPDVAGVLFTSSPTGTPDELLRLPRPVQQLGRLAAWFHECATGACKRRPRSVHL